MAEKQAAEKAAALEWLMFDDVNRGAARVSCQEDIDTFYGMRTAQFMAWNENTIQSYIEDLLETAQSGRNLIAEKYIRMMEKIQPRDYTQLSAGIPKLSENIKTLAGEISEKLVSQTRPLFEKYPNVSGAGRPLYSSSDSVYVTSVETYQRCELLTYSEKTLIELRVHIHDMERRGVALARKILENTVKFYGYSSLDAAESAVMKHKLPISDTQEKRNAVT